jgi:hypothetical protein
MARGGISLGRPMASPRDTARAMSRRLISAGVVVMALAAPTTAAAHSTVIKPGSRFWVITRPPKPTPSLEHQIGDRFNPYAICRHGISGHPRTDPAFATLGGYPLRFTGRGSPPRSTYRFAFSHDRWRTTLLAFHAPHQPQPDLQAKAVNRQESRKVLFFWRCEHPHR